MNELFLGWGMLLLTVVFNAGGVFLIKQKLNDLGPMPIKPFSALAGYFISMLKFPLIILGGLMLLIAPFFFAIALSRMDITVAYPAQVALNFLVLFLLGVLVLGEALTLYKVIGVALIFIAMYFLRVAQ